MTSLNPVTQQGQIDYVNCGYHTLKSMATVISNYDPNKDWKENSKVLNKCLVDNSMAEYGASKDQVILMRNWSCQVFSQIDTHKVLENYYNKCHNSKDIIFFYKKNLKHIKLKKVYFQNDERDEEQILPLDDGSTFISRLTIEGFKFRNNIQISNINLSVMLFFHELVTNTWMIKQPIISIDKDNCLPSYEKSHVKMNIPFHLFVYKLCERKDKDESGTRNFDEDESKFLYTIHPDHQTLDRNRRNTTSVCVRLHEGYFNKYLIPFINEISNLDLFTLKGMIQMDISIRRLALSNHSDEIFCGSALYRRFFNDDDQSTSALQEKTSIFHTYVMFNKHFRNYCGLRFGTILGLNEIYSFSRCLSQAVGSGLYNYQDWINHVMGHRTIITNLDDEVLDRNWETQVNMIRERSRIIKPSEIDNSSIVPNLQDGTIESISISDSNVIVTQDSMVVEPSSSTEHRTLSEIEISMKEILSYFDMKLSMKVNDIVSAKWDAIKHDLKKFTTYSNKMTKANDVVIHFWNEM